MKKRKETKKKMCYILDIDTQSNGSDIHSTNDVPTNSHHLDNTAVVELPIQDSDSQHSNEATSESQISRSEQTAAFGGDHIVDVRSSHGNDEGNAAAESFQRFVVGPRQIILENFGESKSRESKGERVVIENRQTEQELVRSDQTIVDLSAGSGPNRERVNIGSNVNNKRRKNFSLVLCSLIVLLVLLIGPALLIILSSL